MISVSNKNIRKKQNLKTNYAFVDFQGFKDNFNRFIVKEFAMKTKNIKFHDIIKSPINVTLNEKYRKQTKWLKRINDPYLFNYFLAILCLVDCGLVLVEYFHS